MNEDLSIEIEDEVMVRVDEVSLRHICAAIWEGPRWFGKDRGGLGGTAVVLNGGPRQSK